MADLDLVERVRQDLCGSRGWEAPQVVTVPVLNTHGLQGGPVGQPPQLVVPLSSERPLPPDAVFMLLAQLPEASPRPILAIVDSCAAVVYIAVDDELPAPSPPFT